LGDEFINQSRCLQFVQRPHRLAEPILSEGLDLSLIELVLLNDFDDEIPLFRRAGPGFLSIASVSTAGAVLAIASRLWQETGLLFTTKYGTTPVCADKHTSTDGS
jgi:hypothetical protein